MSNNTELVFKTAHFPQRFSFYSWLLLFVGLLSSLTVSSVSSAIWLSTGIKEQIALNNNISALCTWMNNPGRLFFWELLVANTSCFFWYWLYTNNIATFAHILYKPTNRRDPSHAQLSEQDRRVVCLPYSGHSSFSLKEVIYSVMNCQCLFAFRASSPTWSLAFLTPYPPVC